MKWILIGKHSFRFVPSPSPIVWRAPLFLPHSPPPRHLIQCFFASCCRRRRCLLFFIRARCFCLKLNIFPLTAPSAPEHVNARQCTRHRHAAKAIINFVHFLYLFRSDEGNLCTRVRFAFRRLYSTAKNMKHWARYRCPTTAPPPRLQVANQIAFFFHSPTKLIAQFLTKKFPAQSRTTRERCAPQSVVLSSFHCRRLSFGVDFRQRNFMRQSFPVVSIDGVRHLHELPITNIQDAKCKRNLLWAVPLPHCLPRPTNRTCVIGNDLPSECAA